MSELVAQYQQGSFSTPINGGALDASVVLSNDNTLRGKYNSHDQDPGIHLQSSLLASRPAAGSIGRKWLTTDGLRVYYDTGSAWNELAYLPIAGGTVTGATTFSALGTFSAGITVTGNSTITGTLGGITTLTATTVAGTLSTAAQPNVTSVGPLVGLAMAGTLTVAGNIVSGPKMQAYSEVRTTPAIAAGALALDLATANVFRVARNAAITAITFTNIAASGITAEFTLIFDSSGTFTVTWPASFKWFYGGTAPAMSAVGKTDVITGFTTDGGTTWYVTAATNATT